jgi:hypothetical protein
VKSFIRSAVEEKLAINIKAKKIILNVDITRAP